ncbi:CTP-dependent riboflavin kinase [Halanaeroarchaeum sp. HSR-CO]|uniref:CTP-dependent riboflavin kinase n=1 Tax=Halanaeroarchaeum sp. HSR-CO TaxID=2866382 RepID=UPI00217EE008|nr:CTP-dependent riboflavin kinase [Halanaeroarchaeum sp. HSR-CO]
MATQAGTRVVGFDELAVLKRLALGGARRGEIKISCSRLADHHDVSTQTASRRLQALEDAELVERETVSDGQFVSLTAAGERALKREYEDYRAIFEDQADLALHGTVTSGMGEGRHYISLPGYNRQFEEKLGYDPYPGTFNVDLTRQSRRERSAMESFEPVPIEGWEDEERTYGPAYCYAATIEVPGGPAASPAHVIVPDRTHHDDDQVELIAPEHLREELGVLDGDEVIVHVAAE